MKTSLKKLRGFTLHHRHGDQKDRRDLRPLAQFDELARASQDMQDMRDCYDSLLSAAAATANSAYEFSESLREMGGCLLEKTALNDDEESGRVLLMLGKAQYELQKLVDSYRSHISQTITIPSESLLNELRTVEEMKRQCDEKREVYEYMITRQREKGRGKGGRGENFTLQNLQAAHEEYDEEATLFVFRLKSLKQGQSRSLLTQATRHHAAQIRFFRKALKTLEAIEPHVKLISEVQHIDYNFCELDDDDDDGDDGDDDEDDDDSNDGDSYGDQDDGELSFHYVRNDKEQDVSTSRNSMDLDMVDVTFPQASILEASKENLQKNYRKSFSFRGEYRASSQSAPLFAENFSDPSIRVKQLRQSSGRKFNTYVLPTPVDTKSSTTITSSNPPPRTLKTNLSLRRRNLWHSSPLGRDPKKYERLPRSEKSLGSINTNAQSILRESNNNTSSTRLPPPLAGGLVFSRFETLADPKKIKRLSFSGPITRKPMLTKPFSVEHHHLQSGPLLQNPSSRLSSTSPKASPKVSPPISPGASPTFNSSPKISELHELPRPPAGWPFKSSRPVALVGYSVPLAPKGHLLPASSKLLPSNTASPLPTPSQVVTRSFSIPSNGHRAVAMNASTPLDSTNNSVVAEDFSPPLTPITLPNMQPSPTTSEIANQTPQVTGAG